MKALRFSNEALRQISLCSAILCSRSNSEIIGRERCLSSIFLQRTQVRGKGFILKVWSGGLECLCKVEREDAGLGRRASDGHMGLRTSRLVQWGAPEQRLPSEKFRVGTGWPGLSTLRCSLISWGLSSTSVASALKLGPS